MSFANKSGNVRMKAYLLCNIGNLYIQSETGGDSTAAYAGDFFFEAEKIRSNW